MDRYDGARVTYHYRSHRTERVEHETVGVDTFIGRMVPHTMPKGFKRIRYYGVQATRTFAKVKGVIQAALAKVEGVVKGAVQIIARLTYRQRYEQSTGLVKREAQSFALDGADPMEWPEPQHSARICLTTTRTGCQARRPSQKRARVTRQKTPGSLSWASSFA
jgi:hypothetical protein